MIKKILFVLCFSVVSISFSQEKSLEKSLEKLTAAPNPFKTTTNISFSSSKKSNVIFTVRNILGKTIHKQVFKTKIGKNNIPFSKGKLKTGVYIYAIQNDQKIISKRFVIK